MHALSLRTARAPIGTHDDAKLLPPDAKRRALGEAPSPGEEQPADDYPGVLLFHNNDLLNMMIPDILNPLYNNADAASACEEAVRWCEVNRPSGCAGRDADWKRLTRQVFGHDAPTLYPESAQRNFRALCTRTAAYRDGTLRLDIPASHLVVDARVRCFVLAAVSKDGEALQYADEYLQSDRDIVLAAVRQNGKALEWADGDTLTDREIVLAAATRYGQALEWADGDPLSDREVVLAAVREDPSALEWAQGDTISDREIVLTAVSKEGLALLYADDDLQFDREIVLAAVGNNGLALEYADDDLQSDREIVLAAVRNDGDALQYADEELQSDREIVLAAVRKDGDLVRTHKHLADQGVCLRM